MKNCSFCWGRFLAARCTYSEYAEWQNSCMLFLLLWQRPSLRNRQKCRVANAGLVKADSLNNGHSGMTAINNSSNSGMDRQD